MDRNQLHAEFKTLLDAARNKSQLYYLLTMVGVSGRGRSLDFMAEINRMTTALLFDRLRKSPPEAVNAHEGLFLVQSHLESKAFYATLRNFVSILVGRKFHPHPWDEQLGERRGKLNKVQVSTGKIIANLVADLKLAGFAGLAADFETTHTGLGAVIRNATAHATFLLPTPATGHRWIFGNYMANSAGDLQIAENAVDDSDFQAFVRQFFEVRFAFLDAFTNHRTALDNMSFDFAAENQMKPGEILQCHFESNAVSVKFKGTPFW